MRNAFARVSVRATVVVGVLALLVAVWAVVDSFRFFMCTACPVEYDRDRVIFSVALIVVAGAVIGGIGGLIARTSTSGGILILAVSLSLLSLAGAIWIVLFFGGDMTPVVAGAVIGGIGGLIARRVKGINGSGFVLVLAVSLFLAEAIWIFWIISGGVLTPPEK